MQASLPVSQAGPVNPTTQAQVNWLSPLVKEPLFWQGLDKHSSLSENKDNMNPWVIKVRPAHCYVVDEKLAILSTVPNATK